MATERSRTKEKTAASCCGMCLYHEWAEEAHRTNLAICTPVMHGACATREEGVRRGTFPGSQGVGGLHAPLATCAGTRPNYGRRHREQAERCREAWAARSVPGRPCSAVERCSARAQTKAAQWQRCHRRSRAPACRSSSWLDTRRPPAGASRRLSIGSRTARVVGWENVEAAGASSRRAHAPNWPSHDC